MRSTDDDTHKRTGYRTGHATCATATDLLACAWSCSRLSARRPSRRQAPARAHADRKPTLEIYGFGQADAIVDFKHEQPGLVRRQPAVEAADRSANDSAQDGHFYLSPRQSRLRRQGRAARPTHGTSRRSSSSTCSASARDAGQTTIRLRHAWGQWRQVGGGLTNSHVHGRRRLPEHPRVLGPERDAVLPQRPGVLGAVREHEANSNLRVAIERPGASGDAGVFADRVELQNVRGRFPAPDFTGHYRYGPGWGYVQVGGALRYIALGRPAPERHVRSQRHTSGLGRQPQLERQARRATTCSGCRSSTARASRTTSTTRRSTSASKTNPGNLRHAGHRRGAARSSASSAYLDHNWNSRWSTARSATRASNITNSDGQAANAFKNGQYASANLLWTPATNVMMGGEFQWAHRENFSDGFSLRRLRVQFSFKYSFSAKYRRVVMVTKLCSAQRRAWLPAHAGRSSWSAALVARAHSSDRSANRGQQRVQSSSRTSTKGRTPTTSRRSPRWIRTCSASRWSPPTARSTRPATSRPRCRSSRSPRSSRWRR